MGHTDLPFVCAATDKAYHTCNSGGFSVFAGVGERTREGNDLYKEMTESVGSSTVCHPTVSALALLL